MDCPRCGSPLSQGVVGDSCTGCLARALLGFSSDPPPAEDPEPVLLQLGNYELTEELARGGMGIVFRARQRSLNRPVAVKLLRDGVWAASEAVERFKREAASAGQLRHPNIVRIHEVGEQGGQHYLAMDLVEGLNLEMATEKGPMPVMAAARLVLTLADAIQHAHERGVLHRDLKPSNVLLDAEGEPYVTDFGLARPLDGLASMTLGGEALGTPAYMAPEQATGELDVGPAADVYGLGAVFYHLLTGGPPFSGSSAVEMVRQVVEVDPVAPAVRNPMVPRDLSAICLKCLEKSPRARYASAAALSEDLGRWLRGEPTSARPPGRLELASRWVRRNRGVAALLVLLVMVVVIGFAGVLGQWRKAVAAVNASREADRLQKEQLHALYSQKAHSARMTGRPGQRTETLSAAALAAKMGVTQELRDDATSALLLPDLGQPLWWREKPDHEHPWCFDPDLDFYVPHSTKGRLTVVHSGDHRIAADFGVQDSPVAAACFSPDGRLLAVRLDDGRMRIWEWRERREVVDSDLRCGDRLWGRRAFDFAPDSRSLYYSAVGGGVRRLELSTGETRSINDTGQVAMLRVSPDGRELLIVVESRVELWRIDPPELEQSGRVGAVSDQTVLTAAWHPGGDIIALSGGGSLWLWQCRTDGRVALLESGAGDAFHLSFNPTGELLCGAAGVWDVASQARLLDTLVPAGNAVAMSRDGQRIACQRILNGFGVWEFLAPVGTGVLLSDPTRPSQWADTVTDVTPDGRWVASMHPDGWRVWEGATARVVVRGRESVLAARFADGGRTLVTVGARGVVRWPLPAAPLEPGGDPGKIGVPEVIIPARGRHEGIANASGQGTGAGTGADRTVVAGCIAAGGRYAAISDGATVVICDLVTGSNRPPFKVPEGRNLLDLSADGAWLTLNQHGAASPVILEATSGRPAAFKPGWIPAACQFDRFTGDFVISNSEEYAFLRPGTWDRTAGMRWLPSLHVQGLLAGGLAPDRRTMVVSTDDRVTTLLERGSGRRIARLERPGTYWGHTVAIDPAFRRLYLATHHGAVRILDLGALRAALAKFGLDWDYAAPGPAPAEAGAAGSRKIDR